MTFLLIALLTLVVQQFLPWWSVAIIAFGVAAWRSISARHAFFSGLLAVLLVWLVAVTFTHIQTEGILSNKIAALFNVPAPVLMGITALIGGLVGGAAALSGFYVRRLFVRTSAL